MPNRDNMPDEGPLYLWPSGNDYYQAERQGVRFAGRLNGACAPTHLYAPSASSDPFHPPPSHRDPLPNMLGHYGGETTHAAANILVDIFSAASVLKPAPWKTVMGLFRACTRGWREHGLGAIRTLYYVDLLAGMNEYGACAFRFGDKPFFDQQGVATDGADWLLFDAYLGMALRSVGLSWLAVEEVAYGEFLGALPKAFDEAVKGVPAPLRLVYWSQHLHNWLWFHENRGIVALRADELAFRLKRLPPDAHYQRAVKSLLTDVQPVEWLADLPDLSLTDYGTQRRSPIITPVAEAIRDTIWNGLANERINDTELQAIRPGFMERILFAKEGENDERKNYPDELWMLVADILAHLSVVKGLPQHPEFMGRPPRGETLSWNAVRQRCSP